MSFIYISQRRREIKKMFTFLRDLTDPSPGRVVGYLLLIVEPEDELWWLGTVLRINRLQLIMSFLLK